MIKFYLLISLLLTTSIYPEILICTFAYNRPDFIEIQYLTFKKFLIDDFKLVVFNDARDVDMKKEIEAICEKHTIDCISIPQEIHTRPYLNRPPKPNRNQPENPDDLPYVQYREKPADLDPAVRNSDVCQYAMDTLGFNHNDIIMLVDSDLFLIEKFSISNFLKNNHAAGHLRSWGNLPEIYYNCDIPPETQGLNYFWIGLIILNMKSLPNKHALNLNRGIIATPFGTGYVDPAGYSYYLLEHQNNLKVKSINRLTFIDIICKNCKKNKAEICTHTTPILQQFGVHEKHIKLLQAIPIDPNPKGFSQDAGIELYLSGAFLHYRGASNWQSFSKEFLEKKNKIFNNFIETILEK